jgi:hypothetical protein
MHVPAWALALVVGLALPAAAQPLTGMDLLRAKHCGNKHNPCRPPAPTLSIAFDPAMPSIPNDTPVGSTIANVIVRVSDGSAFTGSLGFAMPDNSDGGICAISGWTIVLGAPLPPGASVQHCTITATQ